MNVDFSNWRHPDFMRGIAIEMEDKDTFDYEEYPKWQESNLIKEHESWSGKDTILAFNPQQETVFLYLLDFVQILRLQ